MAKMRAAPFTLLLLSPVAWAQGPQNSDYSFLFGASSFPGVAVGTSFTPGFTRWIFQTAYAHQVHSTPIGNLFIEVPLTFTGKDTPLVNRTITSRRASV